MLTSNEGMGLKEYGEKISPGPPTVRRASAGSNSRQLKPTRQETEKGMKTWTELLPTHRQVLWKDSPH